jgi:FkbM family methyltransferase
MGPDRRASKPRLAVAAAQLRLRPWVENPEGRRIYLDPTDHRAWRVAVYHGAFDQDAVRVWRRLNELVQPDLVLDIGANYGEVLLSTHYPDAADIHLVEPNPRLVPLLRRSLTEAGLTATIHEVAATTEKGTATLHIDARSSGASSIEPGRPADRTVVVDTATIDDLVPRGHRRCLFKIDVEGVEGEVLDSMTETLADCDTWSGIVEYFQRRTPLQLEKFPHVYGVRLPDCTLEPLTEEMLVQIEAQEGSYTKDIVVSSTPL